jgi:hypothetical protein
MRLFLYITLIALATATVAVGCGGGGDSSSSLTKAQFIRQADAMCEEFREGVVAVVKSPKYAESASRSAAESEQALNAAILAVVQEEAEELGELGAPSGDEAEVAAVAKGIEAAVRNARKNPNNAAGAFAGVEKLATKYGFKVCSEPV